MRLFIIILLLPINSLFASTIIYMKNGDKLYGDIRKINANNDLLIKYSDGSIELLKKDTMYNYQTDIT